MRRLVLFAALGLTIGCQSPPATTPLSTSSPEPAPPQPVRPSPTSAVPVPAISTPVTLPSAGEPNPIDARNAADLEAMKAALQRTVQPSPVLTEPRPREEAAAPPETLTEHELAAARESLPAVQERLQQMIPRYFDAESFRRALTNHPEFRKE